MKAEPDARDAKPAKLSQPARLGLIATGFVTTILYLLPAAATVQGVALAIAAGNFYTRSDFAQAVWRAGLALRAGDVTGLYHAAWLYPPPMGLLAVPFSLLPLGVSFWVWMAGTTLLAAMLLRKAGLGWRVIAAGLLGPASFYNLLLGQNGALTAGFLLTALMTLRRRPGLAGVCAGFLCIKPQLGALLPVVFAANRRWRPFLACAATAAVLVLVATAGFGWRSWLDFFEIGQKEAHRQLVAPFGGEYQLACYSVFMMARSMGLGLRAAWAVQGVAALVAAAGTWAVWRGDGDAVRCAMLSLCFLMLAVPFGFSYDLMAFSVAVAAMAPLVPPARLPVLAMLWLWPGLTILITITTHVVLMPLAALLGLAVAWPRFDPRGAIR